MKKERLGNSSEKFNPQLPLLFVLPVSVYSEEMERQRDKDWFIKMQQLEKKYRKLKERMELLSKKYFFQLIATKGIIANTNDINDKFIQKRNEIKKNISS
jgi:hypothetical protein